MINIAVLGATGYTGFELLRLLRQHESVRIKAITSDRFFGKHLASIFPQFSLEDLPSLIKISEINWQDIDLAFLALPHGTTQEIALTIPQNVKIIDLSADFRLENLDDYLLWYGQAHKAEGLQEQAVYGLSEIYESKIKEARLIANPGCYPTAILLPLIPLLQHKLIEKDGIIANCVSGVSGAGRALKESILYCEVNNGFQAYNVAQHRHIAEIEQELSKPAGSNINISFTPHLVPMNRGMCATIYGSLSPRTSFSDVSEALKYFYAPHPFVKIFDPPFTPSTRHVVGTNYCWFTLFQDRIENRFIIVSVIDNLVKGASGQAIQNMNIMYGFPVAMGLRNMAAL